jgi:hypothetical protein
MKIFSIGLSRSGAMTLNEALEILGYRSLFVLNYEHLEENLAYDAFTHTPLASIYKDLDHRFPGSKFINNVRQRESWLQSIEKQWAANDASLLTEAACQLRRSIYGTEHFDRDHFSRFYDRHQQEVSQHFQDRPEALLTLDICAGEGFEKLCPFLGKPIPAQPFPYKNSARDGYARPSQKIKRFLIRYLKAQKIKQLLTAALSSLSRKKR